MRTPKRKWRFLCLLSALAGAGAGLDSSNDGPVYNGKPLATWIDELLPLGFSRVTHTNRPDVQAVRNLGTNAIPWLLRELTTTPWTDNSTNAPASYRHQNRGRVGFWALGEIGAPAIPSLVGLIDEQPDSIPSALAGIGAPALPALERCLTNVSPFIVPDGPPAHKVVSALGGLDVALGAGRISTNDAAYLLPTIRSWTQSTDRTAAYWARGILEKLAPETGPHE